MDENNKEANKPNTGAYDNMTPTSERKPKVEFEIGKSVEITFKEDFVKPKEFPSSEKGVYYLFDCLAGGEEKIFMTAGWSLLQALKDLEPLAGKTVLISKELIKGKQHYSVEEVTEKEIEVVKPGEEAEEEEKVGESKKVEDTKKVGEEEKVEEASTEDKSE